MKSMAAYEYYFNELVFNINDGIDKVAHYDYLSDTGALACFCEFEDSKGVSTEKAYEVDIFG